VSPRIPGGERGPIQDAAARWSASARPCPLTGRTSSRPDLPVPWERRCRVWNPRPPFPPTRVGCPRRRYPAFRASEADLTRTGGLARVEYGRPTLRWREPDSNHQSREGAVGAFASTQVNEAIGSIRAYCLPRDDRRASTRALHRGDPYFSPPDPERLAHQRRHVRCSRSVLGRGTGPSGACRDARVVLSLSRTRSLRPGWAARAMASRRGRAKSRETRRWREMDSNPRSPHKSPDTDAFKRRCSAPV